MPKVKVNDITMNYDQQGAGEPLKPNVGRTRNMTKVASSKASRPAGRSCATPIPATKITDGNGG